MFGLQNILNIKVDFIQIYSQIKKIFYYPENFNIVKTLKITLIIKTEILSLL